MLTITLEAQRLRWEKQIVAAILKKVFWVTILACAVLIKSRVGTFRPAKLVHIDRLFDIILQ